MLLQRVGVPGGRPPVVAGVRDSGGGDPAGARAQPPGAPAGRHPAAPRTGLRIVEAYDRGCRQGASSSKRVAAGTSPHFAS